MDDPAEEKEAYAGPLGDVIRYPGYLAPGMRTW